MAPEGGKGTLSWDDGSTQPYTYKPAAYRPSSSPAKKASPVQQWQSDRESVPTAENYSPDKIALQLERKPETENVLTDGEMVSTPPLPRPAPAARRPPVSEGPPVPRRSKSQWPLAKTVAIIATAAILLTALQVTGGMDQVREFLNRDISRGLPTLRVYSLSSEFNLNRVQSSACRGNELSYTVLVPIPRTYPGIQEVIETTPNPAPTSATATQWNWTGTVYTGQKVSIVIGYHIKAYFKQWKIKSDESGTTASIPGSYTKYLADSYKFTPTDNTVKTLANQLCGNTTNVYDKVRRVYDYMNENIAYLSNSPEEPKSPTRTLSDRNGDCDDQSFLMGSLLRAEGVPAWLEMGLLYDQSQRHWGGHAWMQVYIPLKNGGGEVVNIDPANDQFLFRDSSRLTDYIDDGNEDHLQDYYVSWRYWYTGAPPIREDRFDAIYFRPSEDTTTVESTGPSAGAKELQKLWKMPGFDIGLLALALSASALVMTVRRRRCP